MNLFEIHFSLFFVNFAFFLFDLLVDFCLCFPVFTPSCEKCQIHRNHNTRNKFNQYTKLEQRSHR